MSVNLHPIEVRVLSSLIEKEITTPEYYPLTLNALVNACNQKSNRDPIVNFDESTVSSAVDSLRDRRLVSMISGATHRVPKYSHRFQEMFNLGRRETAIICELMLRGPQTAGELRGRAERMHQFSGLDEVDACLQSLIERDPPFVTRLPRQPGTKESRYAHLLSGEPAIAEAEPQAAPSRDRIAALEAEVANLRDRLASLEQSFETFRRSFE